MITLYTREQNTEVIILLTEMVERGQKRCIPYWPDKDVLNLIRSGDIEIISKQKITREHYQIDEFILHHVNVSIWSIVLYLISGNLIVLI